MYYINPRRNIHISDTCQDFEPILDEDVFDYDELNLGDYDIADLED